MSAGLLVGWWIYVPIHELLHAAACVVTGGAVTELQVDPLYGGDVLGRIFPFVTAGGDYAGRLSGFDTGGSDLVYLATVAGPYVLTVFPGVWLLHWASTPGRWAVSRAALYGAALPVALAPFVSLPGDAYELGSILTTWLPPWSAHADLLRGDDAFRVGGSLLEAALGTGGSFPASPVSSWVLGSGLAVGLVVGGLWAFLTYALGAWTARSLQPGPGSGLTPRHPPTGPADRS